MATKYTGQTSSNAVTLTTAYPSNLEIHLSAEHCITLPLSYVVKAMPSFSKEELEEIQVEIDRLLKGT